MKCEPVDSARSRYFLNSDERHVPSKDTTTNCGGRSPGASRVMGGSPVCGGVAVGVGSSVRVGVPVGVSVGVGEVDGDSLGVSGDAELGVGVGDVGDTAVGVPVVADDGLGARPGVGDEQAPTVSAAAARMATGTARAERMRPPPLSSQGRTTAPRSRPDSPLTSLTGAVRCICGRLAGPGSRGSLAA